MVDKSVHPPYPMHLFGNDPGHNLLPRDGIVNYFGPILSSGETSVFYQKLLADIPWKNDEAVIFGKHIVTARKVAWYGDTGFSYTYSGTTKQALPWTPELATLKSLVEKLTATRYNSCLLNLYHNGNEGMAWHSDDEKSLGKDTTIASVSFGAEREFRLKHKCLDEKVSVLLESGSLLVMKGSHADPLAPLHPENQKGHHPAHQPDVQDDAASKIEIVSQATRNSRSPWEQRESCGMYFLMKRLLPQVAGWLPEPPETHRKSQAGRRPCPRAVPGPTRLSGCRCR